MDQRENFYLTPSPELFLKPLIVEGIGSCYYLGKSFRNSEPNSPKHLPEFTMLEMYKVGVDYMGLAEDVLSMVQAISQEISGSLSITYRGVTISLERWEKLTVAEAFQQYAGISELELFDKGGFASRAKEKGYKTESFTYEDLFSQIYAQEVEPHLGMNGYPTLLYDYPKVFASLAKPNDDGKTARRFEFYIAGLELGNCYDELADWEEQERRFNEDQNERKKYGKIEHPVAWEFINSLKKGLPDCAGIAIGVERLAMVFVGLERIRDLKLVNFEKNVLVY